jgi:aminomethyltransferase
MGEVFVEGPHAESFLNYLVTNDVTKLAIKQALYTPMCNSKGGVVDDLVIYRRANDRFLVVVNASNTDKDFTHIQNIKDEYVSKFKLPAESVHVTNESSKYSQIAIQGRAARKILQNLTKTDLTSIKTYWMDEGLVLGRIPAIIARTGYTGEDGFEVYIPWDQGPAVWRALIEYGTPEGLKPCGLGARDTLRIEMKYALYGQELTEEISPLEAGLGWVVKMNKPAFIGKQALEEQVKSGTKKKLVGISALDRRIPRTGYGIYPSANSPDKIGQVTSGTQSPSLDQPIGIAYVSPDFSKIGTRLYVDVRGSKILAEVVATPFYKRPY